MSLLLLTAVLFVGAIEPADAIDPSEHFPLNGASPGEFSSVAEQRQEIASDFSPRLPASDLNSRGATAGGGCLLDHLSPLRGFARPRVTTNLGLKPEAITWRRSATQHAPGFRALASTLLVEASSAAGFHSFFAPIPATQAQGQAEPNAGAEPAEPAAADEPAADEAAHEEDGHEKHEVATWVTVLFGFILIAMIAALAFEEKIHAKKSLIVGSFAGVCLILGTMIKLMSFGEVHLPGGHDIDIPIYIPVIDWGVITIILGASLFVEVTSKSGVFSWLAIILTRRSGGDPWWLLMYYGVLTVVFSAVLNNVTAMIIIGSLTTVSLRKLNRTDLLLGFLITEGLLTNIGGLLTLISSVPNIIVGNEAGISFTQFFFVAAPYVVVATAVTLLMAKWKFGIKGLKTDEDKTQAKKLVESFDPAESVSSNRFFWFSVGALVLFIACLAGQAYLPFGLHKLGMGFVALFFACGVLWAYRHEVDRFYAAVDWDLLAFFAALFVVINVMEHAQVLGVLGQGIAALLDLPDRFDTSSLLVSSAVASSVTDNIPLAAMLAKILGAQQIPTESPFWWAVIFGANLGGNITPIGSASTVVAMTIINRQKLGLTFVDFVKAAAPFAVVQLILAIVYLLVFM